MWNNQDGTIHESDNKKNRLFVSFVYFVVRETEASAYSIISMHFSGQ